MDELQDTAQREFVLVSFLGGAPPRMQLQAKTLLKRGARVRLVTWRRPGPALQEDDLSSVDRTEVRTPTADRMRDFPVKKLAGSLLYIEFLARSARHLLALAKPGVVIQLTYPLHLWMSPRLAKRGAQVYYDVFEFYGMVLRSRGPLGRALAAVCEFLERRYVPKLDGVSCVTSSDGWLARRMGELNPHVLEVSNYPSVEDMRPGEMELSDRGMKHVVTYVGGLKRGKGLEIFPDVVRAVVRSFPAAHFLIIGRVTVPGGVDAWLRDEHIHLSCTYIPWTSPGVLRTWLERAEVGLVLSRRSEASHRAVGAGNGRKLFTYLAAGLPVVAPDFSSAWALVTEEGVGIQVDTEQPAAVAAGILQLLTDDGMRLQMAKAGRRAFLERYNWESQERRWLGFYGFGNNGAPSS